MVQGRVDAVTSGSIFYGEDNTDPSAHIAEIFRDPANHSSAVASILNYAPKKADFRSRKQGIEATAKTYGRFLSKVLAFHGFERTRDGEEELDLTGDLDKFKDHITRKSTDLILASLESPPTCMKTNFLIP